jgi:hypothetical protein
MPQPFQIAFPIRRNPDGTITTVEQGTPEDVVSRLHVLLRTYPGHHTRFPDLGLYDQAHLQGGADLAEIQRQIDTWVPDAHETVEEDPSGLAEALDVVNVRLGA